jgi:hypothetical protein
MGKLCARGKAAAKRKYKVYPSAYANGYAVQVCKGTKPDGSGKKKTASGYKKGKKKATAKKRTTRKSTRRTTRRK